MDIPRRLFLVILHTILLASRLKFTLICDSYSDLLCANNLV
jgi:hypothetical protein